MALHHRVHICHSADIMQKKTSLLKHKSEAFLEGVCLEYLKTLNSRTRITKFKSHEMMMASSTSKTGWLPY